MTRPALLTMLDMLDETLARGDVANARLIVAEMRVAMERPTGEFPPLMRDTIDLPEPIPDLDDETGTTTVPIRRTIIERGGKQGADR